ncbi:MAG: methylenetetrahydrofolate--tRNA-(uracil(54)-C(5))-methyltransferase (FADH(2)-oxidizing) TrmFO [Myxococcota bacterium]|nr:methylenetetrahydrofolate--tRNA-(uracil(54)-C(5))-methyltransferase (FADH(2)-oxidizing) TrmFO [Myxococcota bacterium]
MGNSRSDTGRRPLVVVVGAGLAGCEAAWQAARCGAAVRLFEMRPAQASPAHSGADFAELVCSNSLRSDQLGNAVGLLKEEMRRFGSLVLAAADETAVPAGRALAVDRHAFARRITEAVEAHPQIEVRRERVDCIPDAPHVILATGPLTAEALAAAIQRLLGDESLYFYDAISPIVYADSVDPSVAFRASRWEDGPGDYWNLPLDKDQYEAFVDALLAADTVPLHPFEQALYFEGCLPVEEMARRGRETLAHGPMKPVGLTDPRTGRWPHAVVQLRQEDKRGVLYNLVGFQTKLRIGAQREVFRSLPGLAEAVFARFGSVHRNTYVNAPRRLVELEVRARPGLYLAGQMAGVEGYVESAALGGLAGVFAARAALGAAPALPPAETAHGALLHHLRDADPAHFQPMNVSWGLFPPLGEATGRVPRRDRKRERNRRLGERALAAFGAWTERVRADA